MRPQFVPFGMMSFLLGCAASTSSGERTTVHPADAHPAPISRLTIGEATITGGVDASTLRRQLEERHPHLSYCYEKHLVVQPTLAGTVTAAFTIGENGRVREVRATGLGNSEVERCISSVLRTIQFPEPSRGPSVDVTLPLLLTPGA